MTAREYFFLSRLISQDLALRHGPEFDDPTRGRYIPDDLPLTARALRRVNLKPPGLKRFLRAHADHLAALPDLRLAETSESLARLLTVR